MPDDLSRIYADMLDDEEPHRQCMNTRHISLLHEPVDGGMFSLKPCVIQVADDGIFANW